FSPSNFAAEIAPARTFALAEQIEQLRSAGLIKGGTLENALVAGDRGWLNPPLRFANEPVRHKLLDLVGDLSLLGSSLPVAHFLAYKASHKLHVKLAKTIAEGKRKMSEGRKGSIPNI
uniref:UDP-3-O-acyl-N-acetylglucosamine deacetylase n=1 Tax=Anaplasma marginale TaxID=770 RepID=UPI001145DD45